VIRTVWLGFAFLIVIVGAGSFRFASGNFDAANASVVIRPPGDRVVAAKTVVPKTAVQQDFTKRPPSTYVLSAQTIVEPAKVNDSSAELLLQLPSAITESSRASQRRREVSAPATMRTKNRKATRKPIKSNSDLSNDQAAAEPKACQLQEFDAVRWAFNVPTGCFT
jgi:hypothetical protein